MLDTSPHRLVTTLEERIAGLEAEFHDAYWNSQISATPENERRRAELELQLRDLKGDPESLRAVEHALGEELHDAVLRRQLEVLRLSLTANQMDAQRRSQVVELSSSIESDFAAYRPTIDDKPVTENDIEHILKHSEDQAMRQRAWEASKEIGAMVAPRVRELARLRNAAALDLGYGDFYTMALELQELSQEWLFETFAEVERLTDEPFRRWKEELDERLRGRFGTKELYPWHYSDPFFQQLPVDGRVSLDEQLERADASELARRTFELWGIDIAGVLERSDLYPRANKSQHAFCLDVDRSAKDVRILANIVPGERWVEIMLHECGHAAYDVSIDTRLPYFLRRPAHTFVTEAAAILSGRLARDPRWLADVARLPSADVSALEPELELAGRAQILLFARWVLVVTHFERDLYRDPEADLDSRWWELREHFQLLAPPPDRVAPDWASKVHIATAPAYYQNYLLGEMLASQLRRTCERECGGFVGVPEAGALLADRLFYPGNLLRWDSLIEEATGRSLAPEDFVADAGS